MFWGRLEIGRGVTIIKLIVNINKSTTFLPRRRAGLLTREQGKSAEAKRQMGKYQSKEIHDGSKVSLKSV